MTKKLLKREAVESWEGEIYLQVLSQTDQDILRIPDSEEDVFVSKCERIADKYIRRIKADRRGL